MNLLNEGLTELVPPRRSSVHAGLPDDAAPAPAAGSIGGPDPESHPEAVVPGPVGPVPTRGAAAVSTGAGGGARDAAMAMAGNAGARGAAAAAMADNAGPGRGRDEDAVGRFIERFAGILFESGVPRMPARVFVALLSADSDQLTAADLAAILRVSPAAVSGAVRYLIQVGLVSGAGEPGSRRLSYSVPPNMWEQLLSMRDQTMSRWTAVLRDGVDVLGRDSPAGERMTQSVRFFDFVAAELSDVMARWHEYQASLDRPG